MRKPQLQFVVQLLLLTSLSVAADEVKHNFVPREGLVPDAETAVSIAVAVWTPIYGSKNIAGQKPYRATLGVNGVWFVSGSLPKNTIGGVAEAEIAKSDGRVLRVSHGR